MTCSSILENYFCQKTCELSSCKMSTGISGTGALRVGAALMKSWFPGNPVVYLPKPSWGNHTPIFKHAGLNVGAYTYYDPTTCGLNISGALDDISKSFLLILNSIRIPI